MTKPGAISLAQHRMLEVAIAAAGVPRDYVKAKLNRAGIAHMNEVPARRLQELLDKLPEWKEDCDELAEERAAIIEYGGG